MSHLIAFARHILGTRGLFAVFIGAFGVPAFADVDYAYDEAGRLVGVYAPNGDAAQYIYDAAGNITEIKRMTATTLSVIEFLPKSGPVGTQVTIWGTGFSTTPSQNTVTVNGSVASVTSALANRLVITIPSGATTGPIAVTVASGTFTTAKSFTVTGTSSCTSGITGFNPTIAAAGTSVAISGAGFDGGMNIAQINGYVAAVQSATSTTLTVTVPTGATSGRLFVSMPPRCSLLNAGDFFVPPAGSTVADITATGRLTINGSTMAVSLPAGKKALYVFDANAGEGAGAFLTSSTISSGSISILAPDGSIVSSASVSGSSAQTGPAYLRATGGYSILINNAGAAASATLRLGATDLAISNASVGTIVANQDGTFNVPVSFTVTNAGAVTAMPNWTDFGYLTSSLMFDPLSKAIGQTTRTTSLAPAANYSTNTTYAVSGFSPGTYTLFIRTDSNGGGAADPFGYLVESNELNNMAGISITLPTYPDLTVTSPSAGTITVNQDGSYAIPVTFTVSNLGTNQALANWNDYGYLSANGALDTSSIVLGQKLRNTNLAGGTNYPVSQTYTKSGVAPGNYTLFLKADGQGAGLQASGGVVAESNEANNAASVAVTLPTLPDLTVTSPSVGTITENQNGSFNIPVTFVVNNVGGSAAQPNWNDFGFISSNGSFDASSTSLGSKFRNLALNAGANYTVTQTYVTSGINPGNYTVFFKADAVSTPLSAGFVAEGSDSNNVSTGVAITLPAYPDLVISNPSVGTITKNANNTYNIPVTFTVTNSGGSPAQPGWNDFGYLSSNGQLDASSSAIGSNFRGAVLAVGANYVVTKTFVTAAVSPGNYTVFVKADAVSNPTLAGFVVESNDSNNATAGLPVTLN